MSTPLPEQSPPESFRTLLETRSAVLADVWPGEAERLLVRSDIGGTMQLYEFEGGELFPLTELDDPVATARYVPGGELVLCAVDEGGNERHQLSLFDRRSARRAPLRRRDELDALTADPRYAHQDAGVSPDGSLVAYVSNRQTGIHFDLWLCDLTTREHRLLYAANSWCQPSSGFSPDGRWVSVGVPGNAPLDQELVLVEVATGAVRPIDPHPEEGALVGPPAWLDGGRIVFASNVGRDFTELRRFDLASGEIAPLAGSGEGADAQVVASADGSTLAVSENRNGAETLVLHDRAWSRSTPVPLVEPGVVSAFGLGSPALSADGSRLYYTLSTPRRPAEVYCYERASGTTSQLTHAGGGLRSEELASAEEAVVESFDGEKVPLLVFRPRPDAGPAPVVVLVHGGPESQSMRSFNPIVQGLVAAGYGVVVPNVRGSTGYGKRYASLDDTVRRLDSVRDLEAVHGFVSTAGFDADKAVLWGGSYGGYMVLAGLAFQPERWAAGVDIVGISDLVTFLENTSAYRRAHREREYGSLAHDREFLASASPLRRVEAITAPLFVIHGRNDPRVPLSEAEQLVAALEERSVPVELCVYDDEGHGLARLKNRVDAYPRAVAFLDKVLGR